MNTPLKFLSYFCLITALAMTAGAQQPPRMPALNSPATGLSLPGKFIWFDLATPAIADQQKFYRGVFGWTYQTPARTDDGYVLVMNGSNAIAGMFNVDRPGGELDGATWIALMSVEDPEQAGQIAKANGGKIELGPMQVAGRGRHALLRDPGDALFGVIRSDSGDSPDREVPVGGILWLDLFAHDVDKMADFYSKIAPYSVTEHVAIEGINGRTLSAQNRPRAGIVPVDEEANRSAWVPYVRVDDVEATLEKVVAGGGFAIVAPDEAVLDGDLAVFVDPNGGVMGVVRWTYEDEASR